MILEAINRLWDAWAFARIYNRWRGSGVESPLLAANDELFYRAEYLEAFRDFATDRYLEGITLEESKTAFVKQRLSQHTTILSQDATAMLRGIILDMRPDEALHPIAYKLWCKEIDEFQQHCKAEAVVGLRGNGNSLTRRVLRARP